MAMYERLLAETATGRDYLLARPIIQRAMREGVSREVYVAYLIQAYYHVSRGVPLLALAAGRTRDEHLRYSLYHYIEEEKGHEHWILEDIAALGGDVEAARNAKPNLPARAMIGYVHYAIDHISPWSVLGLSHVLENTAVSVADLVAERIQQSVGGSIGGFKYLQTHGALDGDHVAFFEKLVNRVDDQRDAAAIIDTAEVVFRLFADMFDEIALAATE